MPTTCYGPSSFQTLGIRRPMDRQGIPCIGLRGGRQREALWRPPARAGIPGYRARAMVSLLHRPLEILGAILLVVPRTTAFGACY